MLLFIRKTLTSVSGRTSFNTSHVVIYPCPVLLPLRTVQVSIHLMLLFILFRPCSRPHRMCVSIHLMLLFIGKRNWNAYETKSFNTSHVVIYHLVNQSARAGKMFQYISCCYLSYADNTIRTYNAKFQYISCCYLSNQLFQAGNIIFKFQYISCCYLS